MLGYCSRRTLLADAGPVTMAVDDLADAGILFLADLTGPVTVGVAGLDDVGYRINYHNKYTCGGKDDVM